MEYKISVCMATYNGELYVEEQINSIISQLRNQDELLIFDDNSIDNTVNIIKKYQLNDKRITLKVNKENIGYTRNFEQAILYATGDYIFLADQDDIWLPNKVSITMKYLEKSEIDLVISNATHVNEKLATSIESHIDFFNMKKGFILNLLKTRYIGACMAFTKGFKNKIMPFPSNKKYTPHDYWIACYGEFIRKTYIINEPLILYRRHSSNALAGGLSSERPLLLKIVSRIYTLYHILLRANRG